MNRLIFLPALALLTAGAASAHHSFAQFNMSKTDAIHGILYRVEWTNPHMWFWITADDGNKWGFEAGAPAQAVRQGYPRSSFQEGAKLIVTYHPVRDGRHGGSLVQLAFADGRVIGGVGSISKQPPGPPR